jgi:hypothetical protein
MVASALAVAGATGPAFAWEPNCKGAWACHCPRCQRAWNGGYYNVAWGAPVALVVPPTAEVQTHWGWGVGNTRITPICSQFKRPWPGPGSYDRGAFRPTPPWPSDTDQFGVYYVRGPW